MDAGHADYMGSYQEAVDIFRTSDQHSEVAQLLRQSQQDLVLIVDGIWNQQNRSNMRASGGMLNH